MPHGLECRWGVRGSRSLLGGQEGMATAHGCPQGASGPRFLPVASSHSKRNGAGGKVVGAAWSMGNSVGFGVEQSDCLFLAA